MTVATPSPVRTRRTLRVADAGTRLHRSRGTRAMGFR